MIKLCPLETLPKTMPKKLIMFGNVSVDFEKEHTYF